MLKTIGYAHSEEKGHYHVSPLLFYNEPGLDHLEWITTLFPKDDASNNLHFLNQQLDNLIQYYQKEQLLIIGGDATCLIGICQNYPKKANLICQYKDVDLPSLPTQITLNGTDDQDNIICIDARHPIPTFIGKAKIIVIFHYDQTQDPDQKTKEQLKTLIKSATA